ncbi:MAG: ankyrin repeat domain-containing protein [Alphaproteobacteria bacterium]|nr:ankyrin repeat domain-containing protein [Alphaproteobacteria bacterium]
MNSPHDNELLVAVKGRNLSDFKKWLEHGASPDAADADTGHSVLYYVASLDMSNVYRAEMLKELLARNVNVNKADNDGVTPLHEAARCSRWDVMEALIAHGADINARSKAGNTPLHAAMTAALATGKTETMQRLLNLGANSVIKNEKGYTPLEAAINRESFANFYATVISFLQDWENNKTDAKRHADIADANKDKLHNAANDTINRMRSDAKRFKLKP